MCGVHAPSRVTRAPLLLLALALPIAGCAAPSVACGGGHMEWTEPGALAALAAGAPRSGVLAWQEPARPGMPFAPAKTVSPDWSLVGVDWRPDPERFDVGVSILVLDGAPRLFAWAPGSYSRDALRLHALDLLAALAPDAPIAQRAAWANESVASKGFAADGARIHGVRAEPAFDALSAAAPPQLARGTGVGLLWTEAGWGFTFAVPTWRATIALDEGSVDVRVLPSDLVRAEAEDASLLTAAHAAAAARALGVMDPRTTGLRVHAAC